MIVFGVCVGSAAKYERIARPALERCAEPTCEIIAIEGQQSIFVAYNALLDRAASHPDLEALVLVHDDLEVLDPAVCEKLRAQFQASVAVVGVVGARDPSTLAWWHSGGIGYTRGCHCPSGTLTEGRGVPDRGTHDVDTVDGIFLALSPWAVGNLRFDSRRFRGFDGYDADLCSQARAAGKRVLVTEIGVLHHRETWRTYRDFGSFRRADFTWRSKWLAAPRWKRVVWRGHAFVAPTEVRVRRWKGVGRLESAVRRLMGRGNRRPPDSSA